MVYRIRFKVVSGKIHIYDDQLNYICSHNLSERKGSVNQLPEHISGTDALQLIHITDQNDPCTRADSLKELSCQPHIDHGAFVHNNEVSVKRFLLLILINRFTVSKKAQ